MESVDRSSLIPGTRIFSGVTLLTHSKTTIFNSRDKLLLTRSYPFVFKKYEHLPAVYTAARDNVDMKATCCFFPPLDIFPVSTFASGNGSNRDGARRIKATSQNTPVKLCRPLLRHTFI